MQFVVQVLCSVFAAVFAVMLLTYVTSKEETTASSDCTDRSAQAAQPLNSEVNAQPVKSTKSRGAAIALCIFFGTLGIHRFYTGKVGTAILWMLTGGLLGIGAIIDFFMILFGSFKDSDGLTLS
ncbi:MAG: TM2 domain-containing protein [Acutalibacteraceae bacterium]